jgi:manganese/zinc/iron transport system permease protein
LIETLIRFFSLGDANVRFVLLGSLLIGSTGGLLGAFGVLRQRSLVGDALAHAALPGVALAFMWTGSKSLPVLLLGATATGVLGVLCMQFITQYTRLKSDAAIGVVLSVFFGAGIVLLTHIQRSSAGNQSGLDKFLFGQAASLVDDDLRVMSLMALLIMAAVALLYKEFKGLIFDPGFMQAIGFAVRWVDLALMGLIVLTVMVGLQAVGVVLIAAMLITPAVAARFWTERLHTMVWLAAFFGGLSGVLGTFISAMAPRIPTGPVMVLVATGIFTLSALVAPNRGALARWRRHRANIRREQQQHILRAFVELAEHRQGQEVFEPATLAAELQWSTHATTAKLKWLGGRNLVERQDGGWHLTAAGRQEGYFVVKSHRLWEHYLYYREILAADHVDRPADEVEHLLTPQIIERLEHILRQERGINVDQMGNIHQTASGYRAGGRDD